MFIPVLIVAFRGGLWPGIFCTATSAAASWVFVLTSEGLLPKERLDLSALVFAGVVVSLLSESANRAKLRAERAQTELLDRLLLLNHTYDAVLIWDWNGAITFWNSAAEELYGFRKEEAIGQESHALLRSTHSGGMSKVRHDLESDGKWEGELTHTTRSGRRITVESRMRLVREHGREIVVEAIRDISAGKAAQLELIETQRRFKTAFRLSPLGKIVVRFSDDRIVEANEAYAKITGYAVSEIVQCKMADHNPLLDPAALEEVRQRLNQGLAVVDIEVQFRRKNGKIGSGILYAESLESGPDGHALIVLHDVTLRRRAEDELRLANLDLQQFAFVAAHDLQEPARNVSMALGLFNREYRSTLTPEGVELIRDSIDAAKRMHRMIRDLLAFARTANSGGGAPAAGIRVDCNEALRQVRENLKGHTMESGAEITSTDLPALEMQPTHFLQLLQNLVGNAIKYRAQGVTPRIHIEARRETAVWTFSVSDNGIGFDAEFAQQIFGVFKRLHGTEDYPGNGIGLAICERIVRYYGGRIWAQSTPGAGSTFSFSLPAAAAVGKGNA